MNEIEIVNMYRDNKSMYEIAEHFHTYANAIRRILVKYKVVLRTKAEAQSIALTSGRHTHPTKGKKLSQETKNKISSSMAAAWSNFSEEERTRRVDIAKTQWENMTDKEKKTLRDLAGKAVRKAAEDGSKLEKYLLMELNRAGWKVDFHVSNILSREKLEVDLLLPDIKLAIEIDGPAHFYPIWGQESLEKHLSGDNYKNGLLIQEGYKVLRIKNLRKNVSQVYQRKILQEVISILKNIDSANNLIEIEVK